MLRMSARAPAKAGQKRLQKTLTYVLRPDEAWQTQKMRLREREEQHRQEMHKMRQMLISYDENMRCGNTGRIIPAQTNNRVTKRSVHLGPERGTHRQEVLRAREKKIREELQDMINMTQKECSQLQTASSNTLAKNELLESKVCQLEAKLMEKEDTLRRFQVDFSKVQDGKGDRDELQQTKMKYETIKKELTQLQNVDLNTMKLLKIFGKETENLEKKISELEFQAVENRETLKKFQTNLKRLAEESGDKEELERTKEKYKIMERQYEQLQSVASNLMERTKRNKKKTEYLENKVCELELQVIEGRSNNTLHFQSDIEKLREENSRIREQLKNETKKNVLLLVKVQHLKEKQDKEAEEAWKASGAPTSRESKDAIQPKTDDYLNLNIASPQEQNPELQTQESSSLPEKTNQGPENFEDQAPNLSEASLAPDGQGLWAPDPELQDPDQLVPEFRVPEQQEPEFYPLLLMLLLCYMLIFNFFCFRLNKFGQGTCDQWQY